MLYFALLFTVAFLWFDWLSDNFQSADIFVPYLVVSFVMSLLFTGFALIDLYACH